MVKETFEHTAALQRYYQILLFYCYGKSIVVVVVVVVVVEI